MNEFITIVLPSLFEPGVSKNCYVNLSSVQSIDIDKNGYAVITFKSGQTRLSGSFYADVVNAINKRYFIYDEQ